MSDKKREAELERLIVTKLRKSIPLTDHQLPVGLFDNEVKTTKTCTPRGASQIDLWQLDKDTLRIFELKDKDNNSVGIISELIYYANIMNELIKGNIQYPQSIKTAKDIRNIKSLYSAIQNKSINTVEAIFLNYEFHPLIKYKKNQIMELINEGTRPHGIIFKDELVEKYL
ncbi:MAG: hypothetical protein J6X22_02250 [Muribaculaceae bacterium]|nr:hypothetical protein [Muribaculaceae bacterium]